MLGKPLLDALVDIAQFVSALGTVGAVMVAIGLARRSEMPRPRFFVFRHIELTVGAGLDEQNHLGLSVVNAGVLPLHITSATLYVIQKQHRPGFGLEPVDRDTNGRLPRRLEHGEIAVFRLRISPTNDPWKSLPQFWWLYRRPYFQVGTTLGRTYRVKAPIRTLWRLRGDIWRNQRGTRAEA